MTGEFYKQKAHKQTIWERERDLKNSFFWRYKNTVNRLKDWEVVTYKCMEEI